MTGRIWPQDSDDITETTLGEALALAHQSDYVESGVGFNADFQANTLDIGNGHAIVRSSTEARHVYPDGETGLPLPVTSGVNYIYLLADFTDTTETAVSFEANSSDAPTTEPALKVGEVDTAGDTSTELNRGAPLDMEGLDAATLGGNLPGYYAESDSPTISGQPIFTGTPLVTGVASQLQLGEEGQGGPHGFIFANNEGEDFGFLGFRTNPNEIVVENQTTGTEIMALPIDGTTRPRILGEEVQTIKEGTTAATVYVGDTEPAGANDGDVWIDTSGN
ncbi:hypothetical protein SAMN05421858_5053 [Haladaptatus litoreus]|uniref:Uncharacterized protein n=1 Tax=Haladaptatus litoreus TaxID=553468 RepID=A0A1N7FH64_9EURY|nr:hypothetical protein [Haladaptatus litoreus]SIR99692.1 hypothetical protein SAMN05421858_5053 [Haladaptatus litoreus]